MVVEAGGLDGDDAPPRACLGGGALAQFQSAEGVVGVDSGSVGSEHALTLGGLGNPWKWDTV
jgi:hypothetical protein